ncbi:MAG: helix-hairpin-helix domain-containing protein [Flavobacteriales bacterium]|nr:helix-hairpin-helix domain-containing protein [Flavobacteriales bacterium]
MAKPTDRQREHADFARRPFKEQFKDLFSLHAGERRGTVALMILFLGMLGWYIHQQWFLKPEIANLGSIKQEMEAWMAARNATDTTVILAEPFPFDPNTIDRDQWKQLGLTDRQIDGLEHYKSKGGRFRTKKDLGKMYSLRPEQVERLMPFILLPDSFERQAYPDRPKYERDTTPRWPKKEYIAYERPAFRKVEVNTADTLSLVALPGIGPSFARGIVKYRDMLGGFHSLDQLAEVFVLKDKPDAVVKLKELLVVDTLMIRRIPINTCTVEELAAHPYARWKIAKPLIAYRTQHGLFKQIADIKGCALVDEEVFRKLAPYLTLE